MITKREQVEKWRVRAEKLRAIADHMIALEGLVPSGPGLGLASIQDEVGLRRQPSYHESARCGNVHQSRLGGQFITGKPRHANVREHHVDEALRKKAERLIAVRRGQHPEAPRNEGFGHGIPNLSIVLDEQYGELMAHCRISNLLPRVASCKKSANDHSAVPHLSTNGHGRLVTTRLTNPEWTNNAKPESLTYD